MVNWDPKALTALSDEEVIYKEEHSKLYYLRYKVEGDAEGRYAVVATTRPETIMGDTAMCINPNDPKNEWLKGKKVIVPLVNRVIPVIEDEYVDIEFGTGCLKVTPAHDVNDYMLGEKYNLPSIDIFNDNGTISEAAGMYVGMDRFEVREQIEKDLAAADLLEKVEPYTNKVGFSERTNVAIEPKLSMQWFLKMQHFADMALPPVMEDQLKFYPAKYKNTYRHWMENIKDWCISRQLWWGHRIPAYFLPEGGFVVAETPEEALELARKKTGRGDLQLSELRQDDDCLDTWFSSWLWPVSLFDGINHPGNEEIQYYYPTADLVTGPDIIFFWVARMIMAGYEYMGEMPFRNVYFTGIVRDKIGRKMSKSLGNSPDPLDLIDRYGADGVRMGMMLSAPAGNDILFDDALCEQGRNFNNKIWNAFRLVKGWQVDDSIEQPVHAKLAVDWFYNVMALATAEVEDLFAKYRLSEALMKGWQVDDSIEQPVHAKLAVDWFYNVMALATAEVEDLFAKYRLSEALMLVYKLFWDEFSSWYLEMVKPAYGQPIDRKTYEATLHLFDVLLRQLHPFMPFITEELWQHLADRKPGESIMMAPVEQFKDTDVKAAQELCKTFDQLKEVIAGIRTIRLDVKAAQELCKTFDQLKEVIAGIRTIRLQKNIAQKEALELLVLGENSGLAAFDSVINKMANLTGMTVVDKKPESAASFMVGTTEYFVPLGNLIDVLAAFDSVINKMANLTGMTVVDKKPESAASFMVGTTEYFVPLGNLIDVEEELKKLEAELKYQEGFLQSVLKKLSNEKFVSKAPANVIEMERKKQADAESKIASLKERIAALS